jgi:signal transduction histidine kinase
MSEAERLAAENARLRRALVEHEQQLERTLEELDALTSVVNHHLRSPLVSVMGFSAELELLRREAFARWAKAAPGDAEHARLTAEFAEAFGYLDGGVKQLSHLIESLSKLGSERRRTLAVEPLDLHAVLDSVADAYRPKIAPGAIHVGALPRLSTDRQVIERIFQHLLDNATTYRGDAPVRIEIEADSLADSWLFHVKDNGRGIEAPELRRVFRPFGRGTPVDHPGHGLGLAFARVLARRLGGDLTVDSQVGRGSDFRLEVPRAAPPLEPRRFL